MRAGNLTDRIVFYAKVISRNDYGGSTDTWPASTVTTRGEVRDIGGSKNLSSEEKFYSKSKQVTVRYNSSIVETMKVQINGGTDRYIITYIETVGRNEGMILSIEKDNK